jgi:DNA-binding response OmpR family regulator
MKKVIKPTKRTSDLSILYIESDLSLQNAISLHLKKIFSKVYQAFNGIEGLSEYKKNKPDIVLTDLNLLNMNSFKMIVEIQEICGDVSLIILSNRNSDFELLETIDLGVIALLKKPLHLTNLNRALQKIIVLKPNKIELVKKEPIKVKPLIVKHEKPKPIKIEPVKIEPPIIKTIKLEPIEIKPPIIRPISGIEISIITKV